MEMLAEKQVIATLAAGIVVSHNATTVGAIRAAWNFARQIAFPVEPSNPPE
jgi:hypothetical protein